MYVVLLSGGSGKRLWPLSNDLRSKQYIKLLSKESDPSAQCSMVQRVWAQLSACGLEENSIICASSGQVEIIKSQLGEVNVAIEPDRRDTFPAVALSCAYIQKYMGGREEDIVCVLPVDPYTENSYFETVRILEQTLCETSAEIALMGAKPTYPSAKYGYIIPDKQEGSYIRVKEFREKPEEALAQKLIDQGAIWNCGVFCFRISCILDHVRGYGVSTDYDEMYQQYHLLPKISFDYEVLEKARSLVAVPFEGLWKDLGTWNTITEEMRSPTVGKVVLDDTCDNTQVINELGIPVVAMGVNNLVVVASFDGILVADKQRSSYIKEATKDINMQPMYEERRWGTIKTIDISMVGEEASVTRKITIYKGMTSSYHYHNQRDEIWTILRGEAELIVEGMKTHLREGSAVWLHKGQRHAVKALEELEYIEIHLGEKVGNNDINRITFNWDEIALNQIK
jgi:mannose-1-phosphate guanylyltransferase